MVCVICGVLHGYMEPTIYGRIQTRLTPQVILTYLTRCIAQSPTCGRDHISPITCYRHTLVIALHFVNDLMCYTISTMMKQVCWVVTSGWKQPPS